MSKKNITLSNLSQFLDKIKELIPSRTSELENDNGFLTNDDIDLSNYMQKTDYVEAGRKQGSVVGEKSTAEGYNTYSSGIYSHAEGYLSGASGEASHAEGYYVLAEGNHSHAEGHGTYSSGEYSHAEGYLSGASGEASHAEGYLSEASGEASHAEGYNTAVYGKYSHAEGYNTYASSECQHVSGKYNIVDTENKYVEIIGNGIRRENRSNARTLDWKGNATYAGKVTVGANPTKDMDVATKAYVDANSASTSIVSATTEITSNNTIEIAIPITISDTSQLAVYYNGLLLTQNINYTATTTAITLTGFSANTGDIFNFAVSEIAGTGIIPAANNVTIIDESDNFPEEVHTVEGALKHLAENLGKVDDVIPVDKGGTGATTAAQARINLEIPNIPTDIITTNDTGTAVDTVPINADQLNGHPDTYFAKATDVPNIIISTADPSGGRNGDIWIKYKE